MSGCRGAGTVRLIAEHAGFVPVITTSGKAGRYVKDTGIVTNMAGTAITSQT
jgi:hypothetical protein